MSDRDSSSGVSLLALTIFTVVHFCVAKAGGCDPSDERLRKSMKAEGLEDVQTHGYDFFECGYGDVWVEGFTAKRPEVVEAGAPMTRVTVDGTLCCGIFKGCTIRWP